MPRLDTLPGELILHIAEICTWDPKIKRPKLFGPGGDHLVDKTREWRRPASYYARYHASLARVNRRFHDLLNGPLYTRNLLRDPLTDSCLLWAAETDRVETLEVALRYGGDLNTVCNQLSSKELVPFHAALGASSSRAVDFMLNHGVDVHLVSSRSPDTDPYSYRPPRCKQAVRNIMKINKMVYPLYTAIAYGSMDDVAKLIDHGAYMIAKGVSVLRVLNDKGRPDLVEKISQRTDPVTLRARLHRAASAHDMDTVRDILKYKIHAGDLDRHRQNVLHMVIRAKDENLPLIEFLLQRPDIDATMEDNDGYTPIFAAIVRSHINTVKRLLQEPRVVLSGLTALGRTSLHLAIETGDRELIEFVLNQPGINITAIDYEGHSVVSLAALSRREADALVMVNLLLSRGATVTGLASQGDVLFELVERRHMRTALVLLRNGLITSPEFLEEPYNTTCSLILHTCLSRPHKLLTELLKELIALGVDVNQLAGKPTPAGKEQQYPRPSALFVAATGAKSLECMKILVAAGAVVNDSNVNRFTTLLRMFRKIWGGEPPSDDPKVGARKERICLLLERGATLGRETTEPWNTALGYACEASTNESCRLLALLLDNSTAANIDESLLRALITYYEAHEKREEPKVKEIIRRLEAFETKISSNNVSTV